jgi:hypothetical protein
MLTTHTKTIERDWNWRPIAPSIYAILARSVLKFPDFDFDLKNNIVILWTENLISDTVHQKKLMDLAGESGIKTVYDLQSYWTSMAAILASLFSLTEWLKFLLQIYIELTDIYWPVV